MLNVTTFQSNEIATLKPIAEKSNEYRKQSKAKNTIKAYSSDWRHFTAWCEQHGLCALPAQPETDLPPKKWTVS